KMAKRMRDADEKFARRKDMRLRFKRLVRAVMLNKQFIDDTEEQAQGISMNVKKNVAFLVRQKRKTGILTVSEKSLLRTHHIFRTVEDRKKLCMIVAGLFCFSRIPPKFRARLVPHLKFETLQADRVIIKENDFPLFVYFVVSGEIEMKKSMYDKVKKKIVMISDAIIGPGDWIGEVEILEDCPRQATYVTISQCEILSITDDVFKKYLGPFIKKQWQEKKHALRSLSYFDFLNEEQIVRACSLCHIAQFDPLTSIFSENRGAIGYVHFILSGECVILQCLKMNMIKTSGNVTYELHTVDETVDRSIFEETSKSGRNLQSSIASLDPNAPQVKSFTIQDLLDSSSNEEDEETVQKKKMMRKMGLAEIQAACRAAGFGPQNVIHRRVMKSVFRKTMIMPRLKTLVLGSEISASGYSGDSDFYGEQFDYEVLPEEYMLEESTSKPSPEPEEEPQVNPSQITVKTTSLADSQVTQIRYDSVVDMDTEDSSTSTEAVGTKSAETPVSAASRRRIYTRFIDVGSMTYGGIFGLGETMTHRVIMARTVVQCLLMPRFWLMEEEQNPGNIWQRRRFYLENCIPSRQELFGNFLKTRRWEKFKHEYVQSTLNPNSVNSTHPEDIPIICRIVESRDDK
ncbi:hypothetical protein KR222_010198, partial [Zaprionus bogoriensis]